MSAIPSPETTAGPKWMLGLLSENRTGMTGISARRPFHRAGIEVWWPANATSSEIAERLRELANELEADDE